LFFAQNISIKQALVSRNIEKYRVNQAIAL